MKAIFEELLNKDLLFQTSTQFNRDVLFDGLRCFGEMFLCFHPLCVIQLKITKHLSIRLQIKDINVKDLKLFSYNIIYAVLQVKRNDVLHDWQFKILGKLVF